MFSISDIDCPVCRGRKVKLIETVPDELGTIRTHVEDWYYTPLENEFVKSGFCSECGTAFVTDIW